MNDPIIGVGVLDKTKQPQVLHVLCRYPDGGLHHSDLPVFCKGTPKPASVAWEYDIQGDTLSVGPSVRITTTRPSKTNPDVNEVVELFHSAGAWMVPFKEFTPGEYVQAYDLFRALNP